MHAYRVSPSHLGQSDDLPLFLISAYSPIIKKKSEAHHENCCDRACRRLHLATGLLWKVQLGGVGGWGGVLWPRHRDWYQYCSLLHHYRYWKHNHQKMHQSFYKQKTLNNKGGPGPVEGVECSVQERGQRAVQHCLSQPEEVCGKESSTSQSTGDISNPSRQQDPPGWGSQSFQWKCWWWNWVHTECCYCTAANPSAWWTSRKPRGEILGLRACIHQVVALVTGIFKLSLSRAAVSTRLK